MSNGAVSCDFRAPSRRASTARGETARPQAWPRTREWGQPDHDLQGRLRHQNIAGVTSRTYQYDAEGALIDLVDKRRGRREYKYDLAEQLISSASVSLGQHTYAYDANGNLVGKDMDGLGYQSGNRLQTMGDIVFERDVNGQMTRQTSPERDDRYEWDPLGQLVRVRHRDGAETTFGYDAFGRRVFKEHRRAEQTNVALPASTLDARINRAALTRYWWSGDDLLAEDRSAQLTEYAMWNYLTNALWEDGQLRHVVNSQQGVPRELLDERGKIVWHGDFDDWAHLVSEHGKATCRLRLPGQIADEETGLHYNRFRYYLPEAGRFVSADPIGFAGGTNGYRFAPNSVRWVDPLGLVCQPGHDRDVEGVVPTDLHAFGNTKQPRPTRIDNPKGNSDLRTDSSGLIQPTATHGASTFGDPSNASLGGHYHTLPAGTQLPDGLGVISDGSDVGGTHAPTHHTIVPTRPMTPGEYHGLVGGLPWSYGGKK